MMKTIGSEVKRMISFDKKGFTVIVLLGLMTSLLAVGYTVSMSTMIDALAAGEYVRGIWLFALFAGIVFGRDMLNGVYNFQFSCHQMVVEGEMRKAVMNAVQKIPPVKWENPSVLDQVNKAENGIETTVYYILGGVEIMCSNTAIYLVMLGIYLCRIHPLLIVVIAAAVIPNLHSYLVKIRIGKEAEDKNAPLRRRMDHAEDAVCKGEYFKETRHLGATGYFMDMFQKTALELKQIRYEKAGKECRTNLLVNASYFLGFTAILGVVCLLAAKGQITVGNIVAVLATVQVLMGYVTEIFSDKLAAIAEAYPGLQNIHQVLDTESVENPPQKTAIQTLTLSDVSFAYPGSDQMALDGISLTLHAGETVCVVGENGSGKTTLSKILLGLYPPTRGSLWLNGEQLAKEDIASLREASSAVFQQFNKYALTLKDNVSFGSGEGKKDVLRELTEHVPEGEDTLLSREFGGVDLSQGQWQRVAIARGLSKEGSLIVFDEPTSAIDPILERELLEQMLFENVHAIKVMITHRIGIATQADRILVMENGKIVQDGNHQELMKQEGPYARLFRTQGSWYQE